MNIMNASPVAWLHNSGKQRKGGSCETPTKLGQSGKEGRRVQLPVSVFSKTNSFVLIS